MSEKRDNSGTLGRNDRREKDSHPTHTGKATIAGVDYWVNAWTKTGPDGSKFFSLSFKPKEAREAKPVAPPDPAEFNDEIPF